MTPDRPETPEALAASTSWMPEISDPALRLAAAAAYRAAPDQGRSAAARRSRYLAACAAIGTDYEALLAARGDAQSARRATAHEQAEAEAAANRQAAIAAVVEPLEVVFARAKQHTEGSRWVFCGGHFRRFALHTFSSADSLGSTWHGANGDAYQALVSILGRRRRGEGKKADLPADFRPTRQALRLAADLVRGVRVSPARCMAIVDAHARGWAIMRAGGPERVARRLPLVERTPAGELRDGRSAGLATDVLLVRDSTSRKTFALNVTRPVARNHRTVRRALREVNQIDCAKIIAQS